MRKVFSNNQHISPDFKAYILVSRGDRRFFSLRQSSRKTEASGAVKDKLSFHF
jgi:hypothetical protein